ncbi:MAG: pentapeptide repeat-containing protein [Acidimicrobiales bacterium]|nr:pentapeptide repeat-containing protein [Acidimicrobiales bacterium]
MEAVEVNGYTIEPGADLNGANLSEANLTGAIADEDTRWPEGFDPVVAGVTFE